MARSYSDPSYPVTFGCHPDWQGSVDESKPFKQAEAQDMWQMKASEHSAAQDACFKSPLHGTLGEAYHNLASEEPIAASDHVTSHNAWLAESHTAYCQDKPSETPCPESAPLLNPDKPLGLSAEQLVSMYRHMVTLRTFDERAKRLQRTGKIGFCVTARGEEAIQIGTAAALTPSDWIMPSYRSHGVALYRGVSLERLMHHMFGTSEDACKGRPMPCHASFKDINYVGISSVIGTQIIHGAGVALAAKLKGETTVCATYFGDGATSANDFHSAMNFAGVFQAPVIFCCVNNQYAISLPASKQTASETMAQKAVAYGFPGFRVDGTDVLAVHTAMQDAVERARNGQGPTLLEFYTYRFDPHSSSDDPSRYRSADETAAWQARDPIENFRHRLMSWGFWSDEQEQALQSDVFDAAMAASKRAEVSALPDWETVFTQVYATMPPHLREQYQELMRDEQGLTLEHAGEFPL
ncbi:MAG: thiamine pyrophosphate-dependent dehydrogenase E1 component subunit alpha [Vampirovibrionales bacterium]|nr:thiamine pyrophosphate-dependent dehydrogenase E1 component subunit alpha [Vampirovibrionales bacterium]